MEYRKHRHWGRPAAVAALLGSAGLVAPQALGVAAASSPPPNPAALLAASKAALAHAPRFTMNGYVTEGAARLDVLVRSADGGNVAEGVLGSNSARLFDYVGSFSFVRIGAALYIEGNQLYWASAVNLLGIKLTPAQLDSLGRRWFRLPGTMVQRFAAHFGALTNPSRFAASLGTASAAGSFRLGASGVLHGRPVVTLRSPEETLEVASTGAPLPYLCSEHVGKDAAVFNLAYPAALRISAPPGALKLSEPTATSSSTTTTTTTTTPTATSTPSSTTASG